MDFKVASVSNLVLLKFHFVVLLEYLEVVRIPRNKLRLAKASHLVIPKKAAILVF